MQVAFSVAFSVAFAGWSENTARFRYFNGRVMSIGSQSSSLSSSGSSPNSPRKRSKVHLIRPVLSPTP